MKGIRDFGVPFCPSHAGRSMRRVSLRLLVVLSLLPGTGGCMFPTRHAVRSVWADYNTLKAPAAFVEQVDHLPAERARVEYYRWMYNQGPGEPVGAQALGPLPHPGEAAVPVAPPNAPTELDDTQAGGAVIHAMSYHEPATQSAASAVRRPRGSWLFGRR
jgi:hypothetical protein